MGTRVLLPPLARIFGTGRRACQETIIATLKGVPNVANELEVRTLAYDVIVFPESEPERLALHRHQSWTFTHTQLVARTHARTHARARAHTHRGVHRWFGCSLVHDDLLLTCAGAYEHERGGALPRDGGWQPASARACDRVYKDDTNGLHRYRSRCIHKTQTCRLRAIGKHLLCEIVLVVVGVRLACSMCISCGSGAPRNTRHGATTAYRVRVRWPTSSTRAPFHQGQSGMSAPEMHASITCIRRGPLKGVRRQRCLH